MTLVTLLAGILMAAILFASVLWSFAQAFQQRGQVRLVYLALMALTVIGMATVSYRSGIPMRITGAALIAAGALAIRAETGTSRLLPLVQLLFGLVLLLGLPITYLPG
jgi:hypothetical protein